MSTGPTGVHPIISALSAERRARKVTKQSIATFLGVDRSTVSDWESGERSPKISNLYAYARAVGLVLSIDGADLISAITKTRNARGISCSKLATAAQMEPGTLRLWEKRSKDPTFGSLHRCLKALGLEPELTRSEQPEETAPTRQRKHPEKYLQVRAIGHPLANNKQGVMVEHRKVLFDKIGDGDHHCYWCGRVVSWVRGRDAIRALVVDHLDHNHLNNAPDNLVPTCNDCNGHRLSGETWDPWVPGTPVRSGEATPSRFRPGHAVDATEAHRRIQALIAAGWSQSKLSREMGGPSCIVAKILSRTRLQPKMAERVRCLFDLLKDQSPPENTYQDRIASSRSRNRALRNGWPLPSALDDGPADRPDEKRGAGNWGTSDCVKRIRAAGIDVHRVVV